VRTARSGVETNAMHLRTQLHPLLPDLHAAPRGLVASVRR
jgi:hypothetical protein